MALKCRETNEDCSGQKKTYVVAHPLGLGFAVGEMTIGNIPKEEICTEPCLRCDEGLNVHLVEGSQGTYTPEGHFFTNRSGKFVFAIMRTTAEKYLPTTLAHINRATERIKGES